MSASNGMVAEGKGRPPGGREEGLIRDVWQSTLDEEFKRIQEILPDYPYIAIDTEFPGVVARPLGEFRSREDYQYNLLKCNVDLLKLIQVGMTFMNEKGETAPRCSTWQFNFKFCSTEDMYATDSFDLLQNSGVQFKRLEEEGLEAEEFGYHLLTSGLLCSPSTTFLSFHSGYDFGYLLKILMGKKLPDDQSEFFELLKLFFPRMFDMKMVLKLLPSAISAPLMGGLQDIADSLNVKRIGPTHQAGSDSLLTGQTFFKIKEKLFGGAWTGLEAGEGKLFGLGTSSAFGLDTHAEVPPVPRQLSIPPPPGLNQGGGQSSSASSETESTTGSAENAEVADQGPSSRSSSQ